MTKIGDFSIDAKMVISVETAERCLLLLNMYLEDHPEITLMKTLPWYNHRYPNGDVFIFAPKEEKEENDENNR